MKIPKTTCVCFLLWALTACSSSSTNATAHQAGPITCSSSPATRVDGTTCTETTVSGVCFQSLGYHDDALESVCAVGPDGALYLVEANGDTTLSGTGWTFGPREFGPQGSNIYPVEPDSLSQADETRCASAQSACSASVPHEAGAPSDAGGD